MNGPYPNILFHFTSRVGLHGILKEGFRVSYAREKIVGASKSKEFAVPMVSFCDLRLSELPFHMSKYGRFGIGMKKVWAQASGLNPVAYASKDSEFTNSLFEGVESYFAQLDDIGDWNKLLKAQASYMKILNALRYIKNYEGELRRKGRIIPNYRYADEREWRHVLPLATKNILPFVAKENILTSEHKASFNEQLTAFKLGFHASDIKYIIVPSERNVRPLWSHIEGLSSRFDSSARQHLQARIITAEQVRADM